MKLPSHLTVSNNNLFIGGHDCNLLASEYGTPLYVTSEDRILQNYSDFFKALKTHYDPVRILYAAKDNGNLAIFRALAQLGAGADVFSTGELRLAEIAGMPHDRLLFNGSSKTKEDLALAVEKGVTVTLDSIDELHKLDTIADESRSKAQVSFRVNPAINVPTHPKIATGLSTSKFGIPHQKIIPAYMEALSCENITPAGIHCHIGSQILATEPFVKATEVMMQLACELHDLSIRFSFVDLGGGLGIPYRHGVDKAPSYREYADAVMPVFLKGIKEMNEHPQLWVEPGRSLVADSTVLLTRVNSVKEAHRRFVNVDAGFNLLIRPTMYEAYHEIVVANKADSPCTAEYTITGPICETGDVFAEGRLLPEIKAGDLVALLDTGAYGFSMSSQYNTRPRCAEVILKGRDKSLMRRKETIEDITRTMVTPPWQDEPRRS